MSDTEYAALLTAFESLLNACTDQLYRSPKKPTKTAFEAAWAAYDSISPLYFSARATGDA